MHQPNPTVSAIVPCYNAEKTIERCLNSILGQSFAVMEILVYDDFSMDGSAAVLARMAKQHACIRVFSGIENKGVGFARTVLLKAARGTHLAFLDADDLWHPNKLKVQLDLMQRQKADISACDYVVCDGEGKKLGIRRLPRSINSFKMHLRNEIPTSMAVLRSDLEGCRAMPMLRRRQDYAYWLNIFVQNPGLKCVSTPDVLGTYYRLPGSLSSSITANLKANYHMFRTTQNYTILFSAVCVFANVITRIMRI